MYVCRYVDVYVHVCMYVCVYVCMYVYACVRACVHVDLHGKMSRSRSSPNALFWIILKRIPGISDGSNHVGHFLGPYLALHYSSIRPVSIPSLQMNRDRSYL